MVMAADGFGGVIPEHKFLIVECLRQLGYRGPYDSLSWAERILWNYRKLNRSAVSVMMKGVRLSNRLCK